VQITIKEGNVSINTIRLAAAREGETTFDGTPCKNCGTTRRYTINGTCVECSGARAREGMRKNREKIKALLKLAKGGA
jgi:hypothetical protein